MLLLNFLNQAVFTQDTTCLDKLVSLPDKPFGDVNKKARSIKETLVKATNKYSSKLQRTEERLKRQVWNGQRDKT